jgi:hypothetical protein
MCAMRKTLFVFIVVLALSITIPAGLTQARGSYENSLVLAPLYVDYTGKTATQFASDAAELKRRLGNAPYVMLGFSAYISIAYPAVPLDRPITEADMAATLNEADVIVNRARDNGIVTHIALVSGFFHGSNELQRAAIQADVRNAQWFSDGWIAPPDQLTDPETPPRSVWTTPSRYAQPMHTRIEEATRILGQHLAGLMAQNPDTFITISGDGEVELSYERSYDEGATKISTTAPLMYADYSPFAIEEFRDWIRASRYDGDVSPATDDNLDGHTFNGDFKQSFSTWRLRYYDNSPPIPYSEYLRLPEKLPSSGTYAIPDGFDAPRSEASDDAFWNVWLEFRKGSVKNWVHDFAGWITTSPAPASGFQIPFSRFYSHQIPADLIFGESDNPRIRTSASYIETAVLEPFGGTGVTAFNGWDGKGHKKTATPELYSQLFMTSDNWGIMEYNPSLSYSNDVPSSDDLPYYMNELRMLWQFRPHVIIPFAWSDLPEHRQFSIQGTMFEQALNRFVRDVGQRPWFSWRAVLR